MLEARGMSTPRVIRMADLSNRSSSVRVTDYAHSIMFLSICFFADVALRVHVWRGRRGDDVRGRHVVDGD